MKLLALGLLVAFLATLTNATDSERAGALSAFRIEQKSGAGAGGPNQTSSLTASCDQDEILFSSGFFSVERGTSLLSAQPTDDDTYQVTWRNDGSADSITLRLVCSTIGTFDLLKSEPFPGVANGMASGKPECEEGSRAIHGGFKGLSTSSSLSGDADGDADVDGADFLTWRASWRSGQTPDEVFVAVYCIDSFATALEVEQVKGFGSSAPNNSASHELTCSNPNANVAGVGVRGLDRGTTLAALGPLDIYSGRVTWRNDSTADEVTLRILCVVFT